MRQCLVVVGLGERDVKSSSSTACELYDILGNAPAEGISAEPQEAIEDHLKAQLLLCKVLVPLCAGHPRAIGSANAYLQNAVMYRQQSAHGHTFAMPEVPSRLYYAFDDTQPKFHSHLPSKVSL